MYDTLKVFFILVVETLDPKSEEGHGEEEDFQFFLVAVGDAVLDSYTRQNAFPGITTC